MIVIKLFAALVVLGILGATAWYVKEVKDRVAVPQMEAAQLLASMETDSPEEVEPGDLAFQRAIELVATGRYEEAEEKLQFIVNFGITHRDLRFFYCQPLIFPKFKLGSYIDLGFINKGAVPLKTMGFYFRVDDRIEFFLFNCIKIRGLDQFLANFRPDMITKILFQNTSGNLSFSKALEVNL